MRIVALLFLLLTSASWSQDTIRVYFEFGSAKMKKEYHPLIGNISSDYDLTLVDSIQFIGYADSVGKLNANIRLSKKRARSVQRFAKHSLERDIPYQILAKGEATRGDESLNRRVEIILFYPQEKPETPIEVVANVDPACFFIDLEALQYCHLRTIKKKRKESVYIEALVASVIKDREHFYAKEDTKGNVKAQRLKWKLKKTGMLWWKKTRYVTTIPKKSFDKFHFFTMEDAPCDGCKETILTKDTSIFIGLHSYTDAFLMHNSQTKIRFFGKDKIKTRVPREYVDISDQYYYSGSIERHALMVEFDWKTKRGRRRQNYYYARLPIMSEQFPTIKRKRMATTCMNVYNGRLAGGPSCGTLGAMRHELQFDLEAGVFLQNNDPTGFIAAGLSYTSTRSYTSILSGINTHGGYYGSARYQFHYHSFPFASLNPMKTWQELQMGRTIDTYGRLYIGTEIKTSFNNTYQSFMEGNVHLGLVLVNANLRNFLPRIYVHGGIAKDFLDHANLKPYPFMQVGLTFNVNAFFH